MEILHYTLKAQYINKINKPGYDSRAINKVIWDQIKKARKKVLYSK